MGFFRTAYLEIRDILGFKPPKETPEQRAETITKKVKERQGGKITKGEDAYELATKVGERAVTIEVSVHGDAAAYKTACRVKRPDFAWQVSHESALEDDPDMQRATLSAGVVVEGFDAGLLAEQQDGWTRLPLAARSALTKLVIETRGSLWYEAGELQLLPEAETLKGTSPASIVDKQLTLFVAIADGIDEGWGG